MSLTIAPAPGYSNPFTAYLCPLSGGPTTPVFFGALLLEIRAAAAAEFIQVTMTTVPGGGLALYGPTRSVSLGPEGTIPIGVVCYMRRTSERISAVTGTITVSWLNPGSSVRASTQYSVVANLSSAAQALFTPTQLDLIASPVANRHAAVTLFCQQEVARFGVNTSVPLSAFSWGAPTPPGAFLPRGGPILDLKFDSNSGFKRDPQVVTAEATAPNGQTFSVPLICWCVAGPGKRDIAIVSIDADPAGADLARESITLKNTTSTRLDLTGCTMHDEGGAPAGFTFPMRSPRGFMFPPGTLMPAGATIQIFSGHGTNTATRLFWGQTQPVWNNDYDTAVLLNSAGDEIDRRFYMNALPGARISGQTKIFDARLFVDQNIGFVSTNVTLEDGDFVVIEPDPGVQSWAGDITITATGPAGAPNTIAPDVGDWPLPGVPKFALLADAFTPVLVGGVIFRQVVNRTSTLHPGHPLTLLINDDAPGGFLAWGGYAARVRVFRK